MMSSKSTHIQLREVCQSLTESRQREHVSGAEQGRVHAGKAPRSVIPVLKSFLVSIFTEKSDKVETRPLPM